MKLIRIVLVLAVAMAGFACTGNGGGTAQSDASEPASEQAADEPVQLVFLDSRIFDEDLSSSMSKESREIIVNVPAGFNLNEIPDRFDRWLYSVKEGGGTVVAKPENPSRGLVSAAIDIVVSIVGQVREMQLYEPSQQYNATLLYREDGTVSKVVFEQR